MDVVTLQAAKAAASLIGPTDTVEGVSLIGYGESYLADFNNAGVQFFKRVSLWVRSKNANNAAVSGTLATDSATFAFGTYPKVTGQPANAAGTFPVSAANIPPAVILLDVAGNDAGFARQTTNGGTYTKSRVGFKNSLEALLRLLRAAARIENTAFTFTGTWTAHTGQTYSSGANNHSTVTNGDHADYTIATAGDYSLIVLAVDDEAYIAAGGVAGAAFQVKVNGTVVKSGTTSQQLRMSGQSGGSGVALGQMVAAFMPGLQVGDVVSLVHNDTTGKVLWLDVLLQKDPRPQNTVIINKLHHRLAAGYSVYALGASWTDDQDFNAAIDEVVALFGTLNTDTTPGVNGLTDQTIMIWDPQANGFDATSMVGNTDGFHLHLNDLGTIHYARGIKRILNSLAVRNGLVKTT